MTGSSDPLYFRQLLSGHDFALGDPMAEQMVNFAYAIGDRDSGEALLVDPAYRVSDLLEILESDAMRCVGVLATHFHADHVGGSLFGCSIEGAAALLERVEVPIHVQRDEVPWLKRSAGLDDAHLVAHRSGDSVEVGSISVKLIHTPGHTQGSQCFLVGGRLVAGDTLFLDGCGRIDSPESDPIAMYESLTTRLGAVPNDTILFPGHRYSVDPSAPLEWVRRHNAVLAPRTLEQWLALVGQ